MLLNKKEFVNYIKTSQKACIVGFEYDAYYANLSGLYITTTELLEYTSLQTIHFGEVAGKYSYVSLEVSKLKPYILTSDPILIESLYNANVLVQREKYKDSYISKEPKIFDEKISYDALCISGFSLDFNLLSRIEDLSNKEWSDMIDEDKTLRPLTKFIVFEQE